MLMVARECHGQLARPESLQLVGSDRTVVEVCAVATRQRDVNHFEGRGEGAPDRPEARVAFSDIVEKEGRDEIGAFRIPLAQPPCTAQRVILIRNRLIPEQRRLVRAQHLGDPYLVSR